MKLRNAASTVSSTSGTMAPSLVSSLTSADTNSDSASGQANVVSKKASFKKTLEKLAKQKQAEKQQSSQHDVSASTIVDTDKDDETTVTTQDATKINDKSSPSSNAEAGADNKADAAASAPSKINVATNADTTEQIATVAGNQKEADSGVDSTLFVDTSDVAAPLETLLAALLGQVSVQAQQPVTVATSASQATQSAGHSLGENSGLSGLLAGLTSSAQAGVSATSLAGLSVANPSFDANSGLAGVASTPALQAQSATTQGQAGVVTATGQGTQQQAANEAIKKLAAKTLSDTQSVTIGGDGVRVQFSHEAASKDQASKASDSSAPLTVEVSSITLGMQQADANQNAVAPQELKSQNLDSAQLTAEAAALERAQGHLGQDAGQTGERSDDGAQDGHSQENAGNIMAATAQAAAGKFSSLLDLHSEQTGLADTQQNMNGLQASNVASAVKTALTQSSSDDGSLSMTVMLGEATPVNVRFANSGGVTTSIVLESSDSAVVKHLSSNKHDLIEALGAAGLDVSNMKIDVVAPTQNSENGSGQGSDSSSQNMASGGDASGNMFGSLADQGAGQNSGGNAWQPGSVFATHEVRETDATDADTQRSAWSREGRVINITA